MNNNMDDFSWKKLLTRVYDAEAACLNPRRDGPYDTQRKFVRLDLPHIWGVHSDPVVSYQMAKQLSLILHENFTGFSNTPMAFEYNFQTDTEPFSTYMSRILDDEAWREIIYDLRDIRFDCTNLDGHDIQLDLQDYIWKYEHSYNSLLEGLLLGSGTKVFLHEVSDIFQVSPYLEEIVGYVKESFSALMEEAMQDQNWYQFLTDMDKYEDWCSMGYFGSPHLDIPRAARLYLDKKEEAHYHFKRMQLYQNYDSTTVNQGPFSSLVSRYMTGEAWMRLMVNIKLQYDECSVFIAHPGK